MAEIVWNIQYKGAEIKVRSAAVEFIFGGQSQTSLGDNKAEEASASVMRLRALTYEQFMEPPERK